ncbi:hypothetical protein [Aureliella helgolandensis]|uniref:Uncharacterized protein n=1 Tax=Aureliella helgolandensis TaxID=2527968 RepID=A0A518G2G1_9BACT|nr:hypothetical protein [Aureliella helgolandensis]QDV22793.1 hypothetical protein Q31a_10840 [Aureliella helgolandensis]
MIRDSNCPIPGWLALRSALGACAAPILAAALLVAAVQCGCSTHAQRLAAPRQAFYANDLQHAHAQLDKLSAKPKGDRSVVELDLAMIELLNGNAPSAERRLQAIRDEWEEMEQKSLAEEAAALITDDQRRAYSGEDYEKILVRVFLTLASLMNDGVDAEAYSLQTLAKQEKLVASAQEKWGTDVGLDYCVPPLAPYLRGVLREATLHDYDDALRAYTATAELAPEVPFLMDDIDRARTGVHSSPGHGVVYVIAMVGRGPYKVETEARATQDALLIADRILSAVGEYSVPPTLAPVKIPGIASPPKPFDLVGVEVDGIPISTTYPLTDLNQMAVDSLAAKRNNLIARAVSRRVIKKGAVYAAKDQLNVNSSLASFAMDAAGVMWEATESADTRCWGLLPREVQLLRLELPAGNHSLHLEPITSGRPVGQGTHCDIEVVSGRNTYILSYWPDTRPIGQVMVSP